MSIREKDRIFNIIDYIILIVKKKPGTTTDAGESKEDECPVELRNIAAVIRLWGKHWENISNIKICPYACYVLEDESKWLSRYFSYSIVFQFASLKLMFSMNLICIFLTPTD